MVKNGPSQELLFCNKTQYWFNSYSHEYNISTTLQPLFSTCPNKCFLPSFLNEDFGQYFFIVFPFLHVWKSSLQFERKGSGTNRGLRRQRYSPAFSKTIRHRRKADTLRNIITLQKNCLRIIIHSTIFVNTYQLQACMLCNGLFFFVFRNIETEQKLVSFHYNDSRDMQSVWCDWVAVSCDQHRKTSWKSGRQGEEGMW